MSYSKASLDVAVKVLEPIFGIKLHTYGEKGEKVINALKRNVPKEQQTYSEKLIKIIDAFKPYIEPVIKQRVQAQHYGNVKVSPMTVAKNQDGTFVTELPRVSKDQLAKDFLEITYTNTFTFLTEFFTFSIASKFWGGLIPVITDDSHPRVRIIKVGISPDSIKSQ